MRFLVIYAHPAADSFGSALHDGVVEALRGAGHEVDDADLYLERFEPALTVAELRDYYQRLTLGTDVLRHIERLRRSDGLVFVFPTWWYSMPAVLKGYFDRVWLPGVAFDLVDGRTCPRLQHIVRFAVVTTYGSPWWQNKFLVGDPNRKLFMKGIRHLFARNAHAIWLAQYGMDNADHRQRQRFLAKVKAKIGAF